MVYGVLLGYLITELISPGCVTRRDTRTRGFMESAVLFDRLQFAVTSTFHYLFPQLTMGLALLLLYFRTRDLLGADDHFHQAARFWTSIFALNFGFGVVTGIPPV